MSFVENLIDQIARATGLGEGTRKFVGVVASYIFNRPGGFAGFQKSFQKAGFGPVFASWLSGSPQMQDIQPAQIEDALGKGTLQTIAQKAGVNPGKIGAYLAGTLPLLIRQVTAGGVVPNGLPSALAGLAGGNIDWGSGSTSVRGGKKRGGWWKWLLPVLALLALTYCGWHMRHAKSPPMGTTAAATAPVATTGGTATHFSAPSFNFENTAGKVKVGGTLSTDAEKSRLWDTLTSVFGRDNVSGELAVDASVKPASWLERFQAMLPSLKGHGLKFGIADNAVKLDTSALPEAERASVSGLFQKELGDLKVEGLFDRGVAAIRGLKAGYSATDLTQALNLSTIRFDTGSATITRSSEDIIRQAAEAIQGAPAGTRVEVIGHTDNQGNAASNQALSEQRAQAVVAALVAAGVPKDSLAARGFGANRPMGDNATAEGRQANRRIEFVALK